MSVEDFRINAFVRQVLSRCWVDLSAVRFGAVGRVVYFHGSFAQVRVGSRDEDPHDLRRPEQVAENLALLQEVEKQILREPLVSDVVFRFDNFRKVQGKWTAVGA